MKKSKIIIYCFIIAVVISAVIISALMLKYNTKKIENVETFDYSLYEEFINRNSVRNINVGPITNEEVAKEKADEIFKEHYSTEDYEYIEKNEKPYLVYYNPDKDLWLVTGYHTERWIGGTAKVVIQSNGKVLAVWHDY